MALKLLNYKVAWRGPEQLLDAIQYIWQELVEVINKIAREVDGGSP